MSPILEALSGRTAFSWAGAAAGTSYESIATVTVGAGGASNVEFTSIPSTYTHLQIRLLARGTNTDANIDGRMEYNGDTAQANYTHHLLRGNGSAASSSGSNASTAPHAFSCNSGGSASSMFGAAIIDILDYTNTNKYKTMRSLTGADENGAGNIYLRSTLWMNTSAITSIKLTPQATNNFAQYSHAALYGIKGAA
jgi:hypothetical protein